MIQHNGKPLDIAGVEPPHDLDAEAGVIGSIVKHPPSFTTPEVARLTPGCFHYEPHRAFFRVLCGMRADGVPIDELTILHHRLKKTGVITMLGGAAGMRKILDSVANGAHGRFFADIVWRHHQQRKKLELAIELAGCVQRGADPEDIDATIRIFQEATTEPPRSEIKVMTAAELSDGEFAVKYHIPGFLVELQPGVMAAPQKSLKTSTIIDAGISLATGKDFLGHFPVNPSPVLMLSGESGLATIQDTARRICHSKGTCLSAVDGFFLSTWLPRFNSPRDLDELRKVLEQTGAKVLMVDPAYLAMDGTDAGNLFSMGTQLRGIAELCRDLSVTLLIVHHMKKATAQGDPYGMPELNSIAWSGFAEFARQWILLNRREAYEPGSGEHKLWLVAGGSAGHGGAWGLDVSEGTQTDEGGRIWSTSVRSAGEVCREAQQSRATSKLARQEETRRLSLEQAIARVVGLLRLSDEPLTLAAIRSKTGWNGTKAKEVGELMVARGTADWVEIKTRGGQTDALKLNPGQGGQPWSEGGLDRGAKGGWSRAPYRGPDQTNQGDGGEF